ncbi:MAG: hypothetical protein AB7O28_10795 [Vicinamibacterales bacterium]
MNAWFRAGVRASMAACALAASAAAYGQTPPASSGGPLEISTLESGVVAAPEVRVTEINGRSTTLAGGYVGWETERRLFIGAAAYLNTNRSDTFETQYGGALVRWTFLADRPVGVSAGVLAGFGTATLSRPFGEVFGAPRFGPPVAAFGREGRVRIDPTASLTAATPVRVHDDFVLVEPQVNLVWTVAPWVRLDAGASYRAVGASDLLDRHLRGVAGTVAIRFGK